MNAQVQAYLDALTGDRRDAIDQVRSAILQALPGVVEDFRYKMPTFHVDGQIVAALASQKQYMALYIMPYDLLEPLKPELSKFNMGKSCIRFRKLEEGDVALFTRVVTHAAEQYPNSSLYGKMPS